VEYRRRNGAGVYDETIEDSWRRVATALAEVEPTEKADWEGRFYSILEGFRFLPAGRILAGAGTGRQATLFNCFAMGTVPDSMEGIFANLNEGAIAMQQGGGIGYDFSTLRPRGMRAKGVGAIASGPVSFMNIWDAMCATIRSTGARRGTMMATLRVDHPDIEEFLTAKRDPSRLRHFNLSVQITDDFMLAVDNDDEWPLVFPAGLLDGQGETLRRRWSGLDKPVSCRVVRRVRARELWERILRAAYDHAGPGVLFIDRINRTNNLAYRQHITATSACGEVPLPPYGVCNLGSLNLAAFVSEPFSMYASLDWAALRQTTAIAVRMLDNTIDVSHFPLPSQEREAKGSRRLGIGITGLADALILLGIVYGSDKATKLAARAMKEICHAAYRASIALAAEKGSFPFFDRSKYLSGEFIRTLPEDIREGIARTGIRNSHLTAIAPASTVSLLANNVSSGLEPVSAFCHRRQVADKDGTAHTFDLVDDAYRRWHELCGEGVSLPASFVAASAAPIDAHLGMQVALQRFVDNAISKIVNVPEDTPFEVFKHIYASAYSQGLKGCTTFRPNAVSGTVPADAVTEAEPPHDGNFEREAV
jgi:ribonucleoside-diphosphate reductase alpha chain